MEYKPGKGYKKTSRSVGITNLSQIIKIFIQKDTSQMQVHLQTHLKTHLQTHLKTHIQTQFADTFADIYRHLYSAICRHIYRHIYTLYRHKYRQIYIIQTQLKAHFKSQLQIILLSYIHTYRMYYISR